VGLIVGGTIGLAVALGYALTGAWLCTGIRACPASWEPFALVSSIIFVLITLAGVVVAVVGAKLYKIFDTALGVDGGEATFPESSDSDG
jgi:hypothetical protein